MKKLIFTIILLLTFTTAYAEDDIKVYIDSTRVVFDTQPIIINGRTMVPVRAIFEALGAEVIWHGETRTVTATKDEKTVSMTIANHELRSGENIIIMDSPPIIRNNRTLIPARFAAEAFENSVEWHGETKTVHINSKKKPNIRYFRRYQNTGLSLSVLYPADWFIDESYKSPVFIDNQGDSFTTHGLGMISLSLMDFVNSSFYDTVSARYDYLSSEQGASISHFENTSVNGCPAALFKYIDNEGDYVTSYIIGGGQKTYIIEFISKNQGIFDNIFNIVLSSFTII